MIEDKEDFFEQSPEDTPPKVEKQKQPRYRPDDPRYYEGEESRWEHLKPSPYNRAPFIWITAAVVLAMCVLIGLYVFLFTPGVDQAVEYGYVESVRREGTLVKTYEGVIIPYKQVMDVKRPYDGDFVFSAKNDSIAGQLRRQQASGKPVMVTYEVYRVKLPWRGNSKVIVTDVKPADPKTILPPQWQPEVMK